MKTSTLKKSLLAFAAAAGIVAVAFQAVAQVPAMHGHGDPIAMIAALKTQLNLNTAQQQQWDAVVAQSQAARQAARAGFEQLKTTTQAELAKAEPDLAALAAQGDAMREQNAPAHKAVRDAWLALYATFTPDQKAVVRDAITAKLAHMQQFRAQMRQRLGQ